MIIIFSKIFSKNTNNIKLFSMKTFLNNYSIDEADYIQLHKLRTPRHTPVWT